MVGLAGPIMFAERGVGATTKGWNYVTSLSQYYFTSLHGLESMKNHESDPLATGVLPALSISGHLLLQTLFTFVLAVIAAEKAVNKSALT